VEIEKFIRDNFPMGDYSKIEIQRTPLGTKILIHTNKPGRIIGRSGRTINEMTDAIKQKFGLENPQLDVKTIRNPDLDAKIVAKQIATSLVKGYNYKKIGNLTMKRIMDAGAVGAEIVISGKMGTRKGITSKFTEGYLKHCGQPAKELVDYGFEEANTRPGKIGIKVKIMKQYMDIDGSLREKRTKEAAEVEKKGADLIEEIEKEEIKQKEAAIEEAEKEKKEGKKPKPGKKKEGADQEKPKKEGKKVKKAENKKQ